MNFKNLKYSIKLAFFDFIKIPTGIISYSQAGEDAIIRFLLDDKKIKKIEYLDIGTNNPRYGNNTYLLYRKNSRGVCVEADETLIPEILKRRPYDTVLNFGVNTDGNKSATFYVFNQSSINTFDKNEAKQRVNSGNYKIVKEIDVPLISINQILSKYFYACPQLLSLDIEGLDLDVLKSLDFDTFRIPIIIAETCRYSENHIREKDNSIVLFMLSKDYFVYADTYINTIFVCNKWFHSN